MAPVTPWSMISGTEPWRKASRGVPHAIASIITKPNGSGQSIGNKSANAWPKNGLAALVDFADELDPGSLSSGTIFSRK